MRYVFYVDVGSLPKQKAKDFLAEFAKEVKDQGVLPLNSTLFIANRGDGTYVEALPE